MAIEMSFARKNKMVVAIMTGVLATPADFDSEKYIKDTIQDRPDLIVLECTGLIDIQTKGISAITRYLVALRSQGFMLRIANLAPEVRRLLEEYGVLRNGEVYSDLKSALLITQKAS